MPKVTREDRPDEFVARFGIWKDDQNATYFYWPIILADEMEEKLRSEVTWVKIMEGLNKDQAEREIKTQEGGG